MNIITLTTDWGISDNYPAIFKTHLLREDASLQLIDITHQVPSNSVERAAFLLKTAYEYFPKNSVHIIDVSRHLPYETRYKAALKNGADAVADLPFLHCLALRHKEHYFLCENNGIISLLFSDFHAAEIVKLPVDERYAHFKAFKAIPYYVKSAVNLANGVPLAEIGEKYDINRIETIPADPPIISKDTITFRGQYVDSYGNIITNLHKEVFEKVADGRKRFDFYNTALNRYEKQKIVRSYHSGMGMLSFSFGHSQYLEIWSKDMPLSRFILEQGANHNNLDLSFTIIFRTE
ncbi:MAG: SAM-dependent chlorinase/fluorinase [Lentimicrobiaceae bacterium]|nr:SAM-dependent chlorinase/fluorinase [Lentimicrobiaceae bacterium]